MPWPPTTEDILNVIEGGVYHRSDTFRWELLDPDWNAIGEIHPRVDSSPSISNDTSRTIIRTVDGMYLLANEAADLNPVSDRLRPVMRLQNGAERSLGVFHFATNNQPVRAWGVESSGSLRDQTFLLSQTRGRTSSVAKGRNLLEAAVSHAALIIPRERITVVGADPTAAATPMAWQVREPIINIVNALLAVIGYFPCYFDHDGLLVMRPAPEDLDLAVPDLVYRPAGRIIADSILDSDDLLDAPNRFVVTETSGQGPPIVGVYDIPDSAPHSKVNRGYFVTENIDMQGVGNIAQAVKAAKAAAKTLATKTYAWREFTGVADWRHDCWNVLEVLGTNMLETSWRLDCHSGGGHDHVARRVY